MSALVMGLVWELPESAELKRADKYVLLAYADHADSGGKNIYPSVDLIARKTFYSERAVQVTTQHLVKMGLLVADGMGPRGTNRWKIPIFVTPGGGAEIAPVQNSMSETAPEGTAPEGTAPEPSVVVNKSLVVVISDNFKIYEEEIGGLTPMIADAIKDAEQTYPPDWIPEAIAIAVGKNIRNWKYVEAILANCKAKNIRPSLNKLEKNNGYTRGTSKGTTKAGSSSRTNGGTERKTGNADVEGKTTEPTDEPGAAERHRAKWDKLRERAKVPAV